VRVAVQKLDGVESVDVSLQRAVADIRLRRGNAVTLDRLRDIVKNNGFTPRDATVSAVGRLVDRGGKPAIEIAPNQALLLTADSKQPAAYTTATERLRSPQSGLFEVTGSIKVATGVPDEIVVSAVRPLTP
jgi:copper chaperone CopZ